MFKVRLRWSHQTPHWRNLSNIDPQYTEQSKYLKLNYAPYLQLTAVDINGNGSGESHKKCDDE